MKFKFCLLFVFSIIFNSHLIFSDENFEKKSIERIVKFQKQSDEEFNRLEQIAKNDLLEWQDLYDKSKTNFSKALEDLIHNRAGYDLKLALKDAQKALEKNEELITLMKEFDKSSNEDLRRLTKEFVLMFTSSKSLLEQHCNFFISPKGFLSEINIEKHAEYTAAYNAQRERTNNLAKELLIKALNLN